jgi:hypothetical protein
MRDYCKTHVCLEVWLIEHREDLETVEDQQRVQVLVLCALVWERVQANTVGIVVRKVVKSEGVLLKW